MLAFPPEPCMHITLHPPLAHSLRSVSACFPLLSGELSPAHAPDAHPSLAPHSLDLHNPQVDGAWVPAQTNFTSLATPGSVGSGKTALVTLLHEGGHAAHFANVDQASPLCSQERAPTSVAYAENQSMLLDSLAGDAAWLARYARDAAGQPVPWSLVREAIEAGHPYAAFTVRSMLAVPYFEKALYDLPDDQVGGWRVGWEGL